MSEVIHDLVRDVEGYLDKEELGVVRGTLVDLQGVDGTRRISDLVEGVASGLQKFVGYSDKSQGVKEGDIVQGGIGRCGKKDRCTCSGGCKGTNNQKYESSYDKGSPPGSGTGGSDCKWDEIYDKCTEKNGTIRGTSVTPDAPSGTPGTLDTLARILLGAIPLVFSGLSYLYWISVTLHNIVESSGQKKEKDLPLRYHVERMGYKWEEWRLVSNGGVDITDGGLPKVFGDCGILGKEEVKGNQNYAQYLEKLRTEAGKETEEKAQKELPLLKLNVLCSGYFRSLHTIDGIRDPRPRTPNTIREILTLVPKVQEMFRKVGTGGKVVFYGVNVGGNEKVLTVTPGNVASYLLGAGLVAPLVLLGIQDTVECLVGKDEKSKESLTGIESYKLAGYTTPVAIHDLYANMQFKFTYPLSETQSYYLLQDCLVALYYQLYFLKHVTFSDYTGGFAWGWCKYGDKVVCDQISGWMCPEAVTNGEKYWDAVKEWKNAKDEKEKKKQEMNKAYKKVINQEKCGKNGSSGGTPSPLQAFLCDCLPGFTCKEVMERMKQYCKGQQNEISKHYSDCYPEFLSHRGHTDVFGQECAVPMGFSGSFRSKSEGGKDMIGLGIYSVLSYYANDDVYSSGLYQITRCICSLTRRVPRSTGTLFGFFHGLGHVLFHRSGSDKEAFKTALSKEMDCCPGSSNTKELLDAINNWRGSSHKQDNCITLDSIQNCTGSPNCGKYFQPLTGSLYNSMATQFCETYVSWIIHLTGLLKEGLGRLLEEFKMIQCSKDIGCKGKDGKDDCKCAECTGGPEGKHGEKCSCDNVVFCAGVHGLFYRFGFTYRGPDYLSHNGTYGNYKRDCKQFYERLKKVINGDYYTQLTEQLRNFIYTTRALFGVYIGVYWLTVLVYLLWSMTVNLDLMHIQSHWRSPSSHLVPLQRILADGSRKGFCSVGYFQENTGDRLLSLGLEVSIPAAAGNKEVQMHQHWSVLVNSHWVSTVVNDCESGSDTYPVALEKP
ncbi:variant erythrocyte surface antigen-1 family protein protein, putative [Babesia ovis]|uniref:Variant erythrocyte surface antigen-1 family protein protein, putative n=1 Tax=Babesia ovis TaxID=5869 RepID=A0A9W5WWG6_BABOV|nr:variant erythrocyte surface antigen-1 family protein protein, putative [Babesia ovis]